MNNESEISSSETSEKRDTVSHNERLNDILEIKLGRQEKTLEAFSELSTFLHENTLNCRRTLRSKVEKRGIEIIQEFLQSVQSVKSVLDDIHDNVCHMNDTVDSMVRRLQETKAKTSHLRDHIYKLQSDGQKVEMEQMILSRFLEKFQLTNKETEILKQSSVTVEFFAALEKTQAIHNNCQLLLRSGNQVAALSIMEQMSFLQETALEFLYRWVQIHCKDIESPKTAFLLAKAIKPFQNRMILFSNLIEEYSTARRAVMVRLFIDALTKGGPNGVPKPIETYAQDKKRYVGDMLAWLRQYIPSEKENFLILLKDCNICKQEIKEEINKGMSNITEGVCSLLSVRIEYIISSSPSPFELHDIASLLRFYVNVIGEELPNTALTTTLTELKEVTECAFLNSIQNLVRHSLLEKIETPATDLTPSSGIGYLLNFMREILSLAELNDGRKEFIMKIINCVIEPLLQAVNLSASRLTSVDMAVYLLNCINEILKVVSMYEFTDEWLERLQAQAEAQLDTLTSEQASSLVVNLNLSSIYTILQDTSKFPLSQVPGMDRGNLECFLNKFESFLNSPEMMVLPQVNYIFNVNYRSRILYRANEVIVAVYKQLFKCITDPVNKYENPYTLMPHSPEEIDRKSVV